MDFSEVSTTNKRETFHVSNLSPAIYRRQFRITETHRGSKLGGNRVGKFEDGDDRGVVYGFHDPH